MREFKGKKRIFYSVCAKMIICVLKRILPKKKVIFIQQQELPFLLTACCCSVRKWSDSGIAEV